MLNTSLRMCCVCREMLPKTELTRVVKDKEGKVFIDKTMKADGRGAYICNKEECKNKLKKQKSFNRAFKCQIDEKIYDELLKSKEN